MGIYSILSQAPHQPICSTLDENMVECKGKCGHQFPVEDLSDFGFCVDCYDKIIDVQYNSNRSKGIGEVRAGEKRKKGPEEVRANYLKRKKKYNDAHRNQINQYMRNRRLKNQGNKRYNERKLPASNAQ